MTTTTPVKKTKRDLSHINSLEDLRAEKQLIKARIKRNEEDLEARWKALPAESFKTALRAVVPFYLNKKITDKSWGFVNTIAGFFKNRNDVKGFKDSLLGNAKKLGMITAIRAAFNYWKKKK